MGKLDPFLLGLTASVVLPDPGDGNPIVVGAGARVYFTVGAGVETNALPAPTRDGMELFLCMDVDGGGTRVVTAAVAVNGVDTVMTFGAAAESVLLRSTEIRTGGVSVFLWMLVVNYGVALS